MRRFLLPLGGALAGLGLVLIAVWAFNRPAAAKLTWEKPFVRKALMSFAYKVYANPKVSDGRHFLSKIVLRNEGEAPVRDLVVSYQVPDWIPWTTPEATPLLPGGGTHVLTYYPKFPEKVTTLRNATTAALEIKLQWKEGSESKEQIIRDNFTLRGVNEIQYGDLDASEILTWYDMWTLAHFAICMVTPNDPVVREFTAAITERIGGAVAGASRDPKETIEIMKATYDYMSDTGMRYVGAKGVPEEFGNVKTLVQTVRLPRDVILSNSGLCIEFAILWSSILDHVGIESYMLFRPGHAFTIAIVGGQTIPIECTAITPKAVGREGRVSFEEAVKMAAEDLQKQPLKTFYSVRKYQNDGYISPELPDIDIEKIKKVLADRARPVRPALVNAPVASVAPDRGNPSERADANSVPPGMSRYQHRTGLVNFLYPAHWQIAAPVPQLSCTFAAGVPSSGESLNVYEFPQMSDPGQALAAMTRAFAGAGMQLRYSTNIDNGTTMVRGSTYSNRGTLNWLAQFRRTRGGVLGVVFGTPDFGGGSDPTPFIQYLQTVRFSP